MNYFKKVLKRAIPPVGRRKLKRFWRRAVSPFRWMTADFRPLPDAIVIGAQKSGTTSLYHYLRQHPRIQTGLTQETHFFDDNYQSGERWYRSQSPLLSVGLILDVTPGYMFKAVCLERMRRLVPEARLIAILREPVARTYSHYRHVRRGMGKEGTETDSFEEAVKRDIERVRQGRVLGRTDYVDSYHSYVRRSLYAPQIHRFKTAYGEKLLVLRSKDLFDSPGHTVNRIFEHLSLSTHSISDVNTHNRGNYQREIPMRDELEDYFSPYNEELYEIMNVDPWWPYEDSKTGYST